MPQLQLVPLSLHRPSLFLVPFSYPLIITARVSSQEKRRNRGVGGGVGHGIGHGFLRGEWVGRVLKEGREGANRRERRDGGGRKKEGRTDACLNGSEWASVCARRRRLSSLAGVRGGTWNVVLCGGPVVRHSDGDGRRRRRRDLRRRGGRKRRRAEEEEAA
ncbi:hypothetical protein Scep_026704 [Stephania cephalantha]|uniref:Uncharacterized protein n=1 Tax=Stephania cephalantha TaxID=152367 RepID=A0AAP0HTJ9_9MAGN